MKTIKSSKILLVLSAVFVVGTVQAFEAGKPNADCRDPKFRSFEPPERKAGQPVPEAEAGSEISFTVSGYADPETFKLKIRKREIVPTIIDKQSFYKVVAKIPDDLAGKFARIDMKAGTKGNECYTKDGWLIKVVSPAAAGVEPAVEDASVPATNDKAVAKGSDEQAAKAPDVK